MSDMLKKLSNVHDDPQKRKPTLETIQKLCNLIE